MNVEHAGSAEWAAPGRLLSSHSTPGVLAFRRRGTIGPATAALTDHVDGPLTIDERALAARLLVRPPNELGETLFREISCEPREQPATQDEIAGARAMAGEAATPDEGSRVLNGALVAAVDRALVGVRRAAVMTGGGLDSAGLLALAIAWARKTGGSVFAVALDYSGPGDDRPHLRALERHLGCDVLRVSPEEAAGVDWYRGVDASPLTWPTAPMEIALLARARAHGADCVLNGAGGDQLFDGAPTSLAGLARRGSPLESLTRARRLRGFARPRSPLTSWIARPLAASLMPLALRRALVSRPAVAAPSWAGPILRERARWWRDEAFRELYASEERRVAQSDAENARYREYLLSLSHQEAVAGDVATKEPYLDPVLVSAVRAFPPDWLLLGDERRGLFREALRGALPESVRTRQDKADFEPALERFVEAAGAFAALRECASGKELSSFGLVDRLSFSHAFDRFTGRGRDPAEWVSFWPALCVEAFLVGRSRGGR